MYDRSQPHLVENKHDLAALAVDAGVQSLQEAVVQNGANRRGLGFFGERVELRVEILNGTEAAGEQRACAHGTVLLLAQLQQVERLLG